MADNDALTYARKHELHALLIERGGNIALEEYGGGWSAEKPHALYSGTKSFWGVAAIDAQRDGLLQLDETVGATFVSWNAGPRKRVTLRMLLQLTAGIGFGGLGASVPIYERALATQLKNAPGQTFAYSGIPLQVFGTVFARKLASRKQTPHEYLRARVLDPIGLRIGSWRSLADGTQPLPTGAFVAAHEWIKYGRFVLAQHADLAPCFEGSNANARYGLGWWLGASGAPADTIYASGSAGQGLYIVPSQQLVAVRFGKSASFKHDAFLKRLCA
jgi:CubicO group peptidase (beta-lactamase class C family)